MPTTVRVIHARDLIAASLEGRLDLNAARRIVAEIISTADPRFDYEVMLDTRKSEVVMSITDLWYLASHLSDLRKGFSKKTAVLCPEEKFDRAGFFATCAKNRGVRVQAFTSFEDAFNWLMDLAPAS